MERNLLIHVKSIYINKITVTCNTDWHSI